MLDIVFSYSWEPVPIHRIRMNTRKCILIIKIYFITRAEPMIPDDHEEVDLNDFDPKADRAQQQARNQYDEDDEGHGHGAHGPGVSCATQ